DLIDLRQQPRLGIVTEKDLGPISFRARGGRMVDVKDSLPLGAVCNLIEHGKWSVIFQYQCIRILGKQHALKDKCQYKGSQSGMGRTARLTATRHFKVTRGVHSLHYRHLQAGQTRLEVFRWSPPGAAQLRANSKPGGTSASTPVRH